MQNTRTQNSPNIRKNALKLCTLLLAVTLLVQALLVPCLAFEPLLQNLLPAQSEAEKNSSSSVDTFNDKETIERLKKEFMQSINKDLVTRIEDQKLTGDVEVILTFTNDSIITAYTNSDAKGTLEEYRASSDAISLKNKLEMNQSSVLENLQAQGLIFDVKHRYVNILDGAFVKTTYENLEAICNHAGVSGVILSNTYEPAVAVENPVYVYDTGIFNSSDLTYTGKGTLVAVLDTGCDYTHTAFTTHEVQGPAYDRDKIASLLPGTVAYSYDTSLEVREVYYGNLTKNKIVFGYDYADKDPDIMPTSNAHGTHVAGVIGGKDDTITGVALDTQFAIMKVFSDDAKSGGKDGDLLAALEDSVTLGVDAINMSLGVSCGFTREVDEQFKNELYDNIEKAGISLVVAANNDYSSGFGGEESNTNKTSNPDSGTVGSPGTYTASLSVASINGKKDKYMHVNGDRVVFFYEAVNNSTKEYDFFDMLGVSTTSPKGEFEYVAISGVGMAINYSGVDVKGKIALVRRGDISFEEKVQFAYEAGAIGVIVYNNVFGDIKMTVGNNLKIPTVSIGKDDGDAMAAKGSGKIVLDFSNKAGPFMSDFSSWGPTPDLKLKPEITAHGGNILSSIPGGGYEEQSGTSMASPNMCGIVVLIRQYVKEKYPKMPVDQVRDMVNRLCMSTATIAYDKTGNPYSPRKQGAGIADIMKATTTPAYLFVEGMGKTKLELGDDPNRKGVYQMSIQLANISDKAVSYKLGNVVMTESISTSEPEYVAERGYILSNTSDYAVSGGTLADGIVTVEAGKIATVTVTITLSAKDKSYLNATFENGMYVEGFLTFENVEEAGVDLNAPFLAFYGDWGEAPIFDLDYYLVETEAHNDAIDDDDKIKADYYASTPMGTFYYDYVFPLGSYVYEMNKEEYPAIPATQEHAAISYYADAISGIYGVFAGMLRGAKELNISIVDTATGKEVWSRTDYNCQKSHYSGQAAPYAVYMDIPMVDFDTNEVFGQNNSHYEVTLTAKLDWDSGKRNIEDTYKFSFYIDYEAPTITDATFRTEYDKARKENRYYVDLMVYDNHYAMSLRPVLVYDLKDYDGEILKTYSPLTQYPVPVYQENRGEATKVTLEITDYLDIIADSHTPEGLTIYIDDYAMNGNLCYVPFPETESKDLEFVEFMDKSLELDSHATFDLTTLLAHKDSAEPVTTDYLKTLKWSSSDPTVVAVADGKLETLKAGTATVSVKGRTWPAAKTITVKVSDKVAEDPLFSANVQIEDFKFTYYETLFAFSSDIDPSEIGRTGYTGYFGGKNDLAFYPSEQIKLHYSLEPWNLPESRYTLKWTSSNPKVATVDENGVVTAEEEGKARITLQIIIDGKASLLAARLSVEVKSEFVIDVNTRTLVAYKGKGGDVVIPDDEGIMTIGSYAFSHFYYTHEKEVQKEPNGYYDLDLKKTPLSNNTVTSVVIPEDVEKIEHHAFYNCDALVNVTMPESCTEICAFAFAESARLENINLEHVTVIGDHAFRGCQSLTCEDLGGIDLSGVYNIGAYGFAGTRLTSVTLTNLGRCGTGAFSSCTYLTTATLGQKTRISAQMFEGSALKSIEVYSDTISDAAFRKCTSLEQVVIHSDLTYLGVEAFAGCTKLQSITFGAGCEAIGNLAMSGCTSLKNVTLPDSPVALGDSVFARSALGTLTFAPNTEITSLGINCFENVTSAKVDVSKSTIYENKNGIIYTKDGKTLLMISPDAKLTELEVPASVETIAAGAFSGNASIKSITFAKASALKTIENGAFAHCTSLKSVTLPQGQITIGDRAFLNAIALTDINLTGVTSVGKSAFEGTSLTSVAFEAKGVVIGEKAFYGVTSLRSVTLGEAALVGSYAFAGCRSLGTLALTGKQAGTQIGDYAFMDCMSLVRVDGENLTGKIGDFAFAQCANLAYFVAPHITEVGMAAFTNCVKLATFEAQELLVIGSNAFAPSSDGTRNGAIFSTIVAPKLQEIGDGAFFRCVELTSIDLTNVTKVGGSAFESCAKLATVTMPKRLESLPSFVFAKCVSLKNIDLSGVVRFEMGAMFGFNLPEHLELTNAEYIGDNAFTEVASMVKNNLVSVNAPKLKEIGNQAFSDCVKLTTFKAPMLETVGFGAFLNTAIAEFEVSESLREFGAGVFEGVKTFTAFYATVDGKKVYDAAFDGVMIKDGVLYTIVDRGYNLVAYPCGKTQETFQVADNTVRIEHGAAYGNPYLKKVILPGTLRSIANFAFFACDALETVVFNSYYAPVLESTMTGDPVEITPQNRKDHVAFDSLYAYDYFYRYQDTVGMPYTYRNFSALISQSKGLTAVIPQNSDGYDALVYATYFNISETENSGIVMGAYAIAFLDAVAKLPQTVTRYDRAVVEAAINAYNALETHQDEMAFIDEALIARYMTAKSAYYVDVTENMISHLYDMDNSKYSFDVVKAARAQYLSLTEAEKAMVENADVLDTKISELAAAMGVEIDFSKTYEEHFPDMGEDSTDTTEDTGDASGENGGNVLTVVIIIVAAVAVLAGGAVVVLLIMKKKKREA